MEITGRMLGWCSMVSEFYMYHVHHPVEGDYGEGDFGL